MPQDGIVGGRRRQRRCGRIHRERATQDLGQSLAGSPGRELHALASDTERLGHPQEVDALHVRGRIDAAPRGRAASTARRSESTVEVCSATVRILLST